MPAISPEQHFQEHEITQRLKGLGATPADLDQLRFFKFNSGLPVSTWALSGPEWLAVQHHGLCKAYTTTENGFRMSTSIGGVLTGRGSNIILIDDPLKPEDALSETQRKAANEWYQNTLLSRLNDKATGAIVIIMQRLHQDDLVGHVLEREGWEVVSFPAIAEEEEVHVIQDMHGRREFRRKQGDVLHPERESHETLDIIRKNIGEYNFVSQYQQNPAPPGGAMVKHDWLRFYETDQLPKRFLRVVQSWDTANKSGELNDYSVCTTWGRAGNEFYLLDVLRRRLNYPDLKRAVVERAKLFKAHNVVIEDKASGTQLIQDLEHELFSTVTPYKPVPGADKIMRYHAVTHFFEGGRVWLPKNAGWLTEYVQEITGFPGTKYDDQVDSTSQALDHMREPDPMEIWAKLAG